MGAKAVEGNILCLCASVLHAHLLCCAFGLFVGRFLRQRVMTFLARIYFFSMGFRVIVKGKQASSAEAPILAVAPHSSFFDAIVSIVAGLPSTVSRSESLEAPIFGSN